MKIAHPIFVAAAAAWWLCVFASGVNGHNSLFVDFVKKRVSKEPNKTKLDTICPIDRVPLARRVFFEYGAMFVASEDVRLPTACIFSTSSEVDRFQSKLERKRHRINGVEIELQEEALENLLEAIEEARESGLKITPLDGAIAGRRNYDDTVRIWNSRFYRALTHWTNRGKIPRADADAARLALVSEQVEKVVEWEAKGYWFSTGFSKSIFYSVAPPGTSQHLSLLAFDVVEAGNPIVRKILNKYGWFQTIRTDQPHFTYLGVEEKDLPLRGLRNVRHNGNSYWVPAGN